MVFIVGEGRGGSRNRRVSGRQGSEGRETSRWLFRGQGYVDSLTYFEHAT